MILYRILIFTILTATPTCAAWGRTWTDVTGKHTFDGELKELADGVVTFEKTDGTTIRVPLEKLGISDRRIAVAEWRKLKAKSRGGNDAANQVPLAKLDSGRLVTGNSVAGIAPYDAAIDSFMTLTGCTAGTFALAKDGKVVYSRGYGFSDAQFKTPTAPDALMRLASNSKPITSAVTRQLISEGKVRGDLPLFDLLGIQPYNGKLGDPRLAQVTTMHLLEHKGGWDRDATFDPVFQMPRMAREMKLDRLTRPEQVIEYMLTQPLQFAPGERYAYSNFGYNVLGTVAEKATGQPFPAVVHNRIALPLRIEIYPSATAVADRHLREVHYPREESAPIELYLPGGGLVSSAPSLCVFLQHYWIDGRPRKQGERGAYHHFGSLPSTTCLMEQREDGICYAVILNGRRDDSYNADNKTLREALNRITSEQLAER